MGDLQPDGLSFGTVFDYPQTITYSELKGWGESEGFEMKQRPSGEISMGQEGVQIDSPNAVGQKENIDIIFNPTANLEGVNDSMFVTLKDHSGANFDKLKEYTESLWSWLENNGYKEDIALLELILQTRVRATSHDSTSYFDENNFETINALGEQPTEGITARFQGEGKKGPGWYRVMIDSVGHPNPRIWLVKLTQRYESFEEIEGKKIRGDILDIIDLTEVSNGG